MENNLEYLKRKLAMKSMRVKLRYDYYEQKKHRMDDGKLIPPWLKGMYQSTVGWCGKAVDELADRLVFLGFDSASDIYGTMDIFNNNNKDVFFDSAIQEALIGACAFAHVSHGDNGELMPKLSLLTAMDATGIIDEQTYMLKEGYAILDRDEHHRPTLEAYFLPGHTEYRFADGTVKIEESECRYPLLVPIIYRPTSKRPFGHSRISRSCMYYQQYAENTLRRSEVSGEFYSFPQKYVVGTDPELEPLEAWKASISAMLRFDKDADGDSPTVGQFSQQSMSPYTEQLRTAASMFAGETGLTLDDLGFVSDNPSSAEAIKASHESLRVIARKAQRDFGNAFANIGFIGACVRDNQPYSRSLVADMKAKWSPIFEPDASVISSLGDASIKVNQAVPNFFNAENLSELTGIESEGEAVGLTEEVAE